MGEGMEPYLGKKEGKRESKKFLDFGEKTDML